MTGPRKDQEHLESKTPGKHIFSSYEKPGLCREETAAPSVTTGVSGATNSSKPSTTVTGPFQVLAGYNGDTALL